MPVLFALVAGCGSTSVDDNAASVGVDPASFVSCEAFAAAGERREREAALLAQFGDLISDRPCAAAQLRTPDDASLLFSQSFSSIQETASLACEAGLHGLTLSESTEGEPVVEAADGGFLSNDHVTLVFGAARQEVAVPLRGHTGSSRTVRLCNADFREEPVHEIILDRDTGVAVIAEEGSEIVVRNESTNETHCLSRSTRDEREGTYIRAAAGDRLTVLAGTEVESSELGFLVSTLGQDHQQLTSTWAHGESAMWTQTISGSVRPAEQLSPNCYGSIPTEPTARVAVTGPGMAFVGATSEQDTVLVLVAPDGETVYCNDDYDGLDPGIDIMLTEGVWQIYVGVWGEGEQFYFSAFIHSR